MPSKTRKYICSQCGDPAGVCWVAQRPLCIGCFTGYVQMAPPTAKRALRGPWRWRGDARPKRVKLAESPGTSCHCWGWGTHPLDPPEEHADWCPCATQPRERASKQEPFFRGEERDG